jgi:hypothetical protein
LAFQLLELRIAFLNFDFAGGKIGGSILGSPGVDYFFPGGLSLCNNAHMAGNRMSLCDPVARRTPQGEVLGKPTAI